MITENPAIPTKRTNHSEENETAFWINCIDSNSLFRRLFWKMLASLDIHDSESFRRATTS